MATAVVESSWKNHHPLLIIITSPTILNTILWRNIPDELYVDDTSVVDITYSDIQGGWPGEGNIDAEPLFVDPDSGDYHLTDYSPCIGAGIMTTDVPTEDFEGDPRPNPTESNPDMGADENPLAEPIPSINGYVTDCQTGEPIKWALVIALQKPDSSKVRVFTKRDGYYEISDLEPGECWLICIKRGYKLHIAKVEVPNRHDFCVEPK
ncbi:TPA: hypothetical protein EYP66_11760 [Candidatus Poribacteria bacterium]|nr:hypothetical protein [Candidatus Poribacteria bacterium]